MYFEGAGAPSDLRRVGLICLLRPLPDGAVHFRARCSPQVVLAAAATLILSLTACTPAPEEKAASQAFIAPASVNLRSQLNQKNSTVAVLKHGDRVNVLDARRRFVKVATTQGAEGWLDSADLLSAAEMGRILREREAALKMPVEGRATAYEALNIHLDPSRKSPAFTQIPEGAPVTILGRKVVLKDSTINRPAFVFERPKPPPRRSGGKSRRATTSLKPPAPLAPAPPDNWQHIWGGDEPETVEQTATVAPSKPASSKPPGKVKPPALEDWFLVATENHMTGWALARNLMMSIPDDVAQYAAGARITSFFDLGTVDDERDGEKHNWLWTTASGGEPADFDAWRVFLWNRHRHRFETSYRLRDLEGYFPVHVDERDPARPGRTFHLITRDDDGKLRQRTYWFDGMRVHLLATEDYRPVSEADLSARATRKEANHDAGWLARTWASWKQRVSAKRETSSP